MWKLSISSKGLLWMLVVLSFLFIHCKKGRSLAATGPTVSVLKISPIDGQQNVIFDTDPGGDVDDAGALAVLHALADRGEIKILAMGVSIGHELAVPYPRQPSTPN